MPAEKNTLRRIVVPIIVIAVGGLFVFSIVNNSQRGRQQSANQKSPPAAQQTPASSGAGGQDETTPAQAEPEQDAGTAETAKSQDAPAAETEVETKPADPGLLTGLVAVMQDAAVSLAPLGVLEDPSTDHTESTYRLVVEFTPYGAGIQSITAADHYETIARKQHYRIQERASLHGAGGGTISVAALAARAISINGTFVDLFSRDEKPVWRETGPGAFEALVVNEIGQEIVRLTRRFILAEHTYDIRVEQTCENLSGEPLDVAWVQYGPIDLPPDFSGYRIDTRRVRYGYLDPGMGPNSNWVSADGKLQSRASILKRVEKERAESGSALLLWPKPETFKDAEDLVWIAQTSRYFGFAIHSNYKVNSGTSKELELANSVYAQQFGEHLVLELHSDDVSVAAGDTANFAFASYAGPLGRRELLSGSKVNPDPNIPEYKALSLNRLLVYNLGGPCAFCTFQPLARALIITLDFLHRYVVFDWAIAIMVLVVIVRTILHPITKKAQISMRIFSEQMQSLAPKQKKIQQKYRDEPKRMQAEMAKLMREEGVNYAGALGCLPMFLQTPIWIALYAMLYFAFELRHQPAYFGIFQSISGGKWSFLADLSTADHFIDFGTSLVTLPLMGDIRAINVLPLLLGFVFFMHQKYLTPQSATTLSPEQQQQQKIIKVMMVVMFPVMMYNAPSGLTIYFITNSTLGIFESRWIRSHVDQKLLDQAKNPKDHKLGRKKVENKAGPKNPFKDAPSRKHFKDRN